MPRLLSCIVALLLVTVQSPARAGTVLDRIRAQKIIHCGGAPRPGLVNVEEDGHASGLFLDLCRAVGAAVLGTEGRIDFTPYDSTKAFDAVRDGTDDLFFLTASEILDEHLAGHVLPGPPVFFEGTAVMVSEASPIQHVADLAGRPICFSIGSSTQRHLEAWFAAHRLDFVRMGYQEDVELYDTYDAQVCGALASEITTLADARLDGGQNHIRSRMLPEALATFPVMAGTPVADPAFAAVVAWAIHTLVRAETSAAPWASGGIDALRIEAPELTLDKDWQTRMLASTGTYGDMFDRDLGQGSAYRLARGPNAPTQAGGLMVAPFAE